MLHAGTARAVITPPLTVEQGVWGAKTHLTPRGVESDLWATCLVLSADDVTAVIIDLDLCSLQPDRSDEMRSAVAAALGVGSDCVRISCTHTHAGPALRAGAQAANPAAEASYVRSLREQCVAIAVAASARRVPVTAQAAYGVCSIGRSRRQRLDDGSMVAGYAPSEPADPTVAAVRFDTADGELIASMVHYAAHPTTLGYTNDLISPDYPGVTKRFVEDQLGGVTLFLQGAAGDIGPGPGGFLSDVELMRGLGTQLGCAATQTLLEAREQQFDHTYVERVRSGADLGVWSRSLRPLDPTRLQVRSETVSLELMPQPSPDEAQQRSNNLIERLELLIATEAPEHEIDDARFRLRRSALAAQRAQNYHGKEAFDLEIHVVQFGGIALIGVPIEPFSEIGATIRARSPFGVTLFSGYSNGSNGYLPTSSAAKIGGYEVDQMAVAHDSADKLVERVLQILADLAAA